MATAESSSFTDPAYPLLPTGTGREQKDQQNAKEHIVTKEDILSTASGSVRSLLPDVEITACTVHVVQETFPQVNELSDGIFDSEDQESMWLCGCTPKTWWFNRDSTIFMYVTVPKYKVQYKFKRNNEISAASTIMVPQKGLLVCAEKGGSRIFTYHTKSRKINSVFNNSAIAIAAMCCDNENTYIIDRKRPHHLHVLDSTFYPGRSVRLSIKHTDGCQYDMDSLQYESKSYVVVSKSDPEGCVVAVDLKNGTNLWVVNYSTNKSVGTDFNPCSVTVSGLGDIFVACAYQLLSISPDGKNVQVVLDRDGGIEEPVRVRVDDHSRRLLVINQRGQEIRNYSMTVERSSKTSSLGSLFEDQDKEVDLLSLEEALPEYRKHTFSGIEALDCCSSEASMYVFGSLSTSEGAPPLVTVKIYMSSVSCSSNDMSVSVIITGRNEVVAKRIEHRFGRALIQRHKLYISREAYDASHSTITITLKPVDENWKHFMDMQTGMERPLHTVLKYNYGHICKRNHNDVVEFYLEASNESVFHFRGVIKVDMNIKTQSGIDESSNSFVIDIP